MRKPRKTKMIIYENATDKEKISYVTEILNALTEAKKRMGSLQTPEAMLEVWRELDGRGLFPEPEILIKEIPRTNLTSQQVLESQKYYRMRKKQALEEKDKAERIKKRIENALQRKKGYCLNCHKHIKVENPTYELFRGKNDLKTKILIKTYCETCNGLTKLWGGY